MESRIVIPQVNKYFLLNKKGRTYFPDMDTMIEAWAPGDHLMVEIGEDKR